MDLPQAIIITGNKYPNGDAGALRQHSMAKIFERLNYNTFVIGFGDGVIKGVIETYDGIKYTSFQSVSKFKFFKMHSRIYYGLDVKKFLKKNKIKPKVILVVNLFPNVFRVIEKYAYKNKIILMHDSVEWYSPEEFKNGKWNIQYIINDYINCKIINNSWKVIAISRYLNQHFYNNGVETIRIPVILDKEKIPFGYPEKREKMIFIYAGSPGRKDYLKTIIKGYALLTEEQFHKSEFHIVGSDKNTLIKKCGISSQLIDRLGDSLIIHGRLQHEETLHLISNADFSLLIRNPQLRYARAGFPTKVVESMFCGTPVICNLSSDLSLYLIDKKNSMIVDGLTSQAVYNTLNQAMTISFEKRIQMRFLARKTAEKYFDYRIYIPRVNSLITNDKSDYDKKNRAD